MRSAQTRAGGASNVYEPLMSIRCVRACDATVRARRRRSSVPPICEIGQRARRQKIVHVRQRGLKASSQRRVVHVPMSGFSQMSR